MQVLVSLTVTTHQCCQATGTSLNCLCTRAWDTVLTVPPAVANSGSIACCVSAFWTSTCTVYLSVHQSPALRFSFLSFLRCNLHACAVGQLKRAQSGISSSGQSLLQTPLSDATVAHLERAVRRDQRLRCFRHWAPADSCTAPGSIVKWELLYKADKGVIDGKSMASPGNANHNTCSQSHSHIHGHAWLGSARSSLRHAAAAAAAFAWS